ncbi:DUF2889 domain-containing protein [Pseudorhodoferax sp.]|uniref:DUF2889 domain-containing protein n=1 Tax=Pseudorhodoferax sp. TaxID=1993553 RepID=UPI002DD6873B|nr:DUF2889 domain-containing protein [Pseudorhodoferax sp.]
MNDTLPPLDGDVTREELHLRQIVLRGFRRSDHLYEIEACLSDQKPFAFQPPSRDAPIPPHTLIHDHVLRIVFGPDMVIRRIGAVMRSFPYGPCPGAVDVMQAMVGVRIGPGWAAALRQRLPPGDACAHFKELMTVVASAAYQTMFSVRSTRDLPDLDASGRPRKIDSCFAYGASRELVQRLWPEHHRPATGVPKGELP